MSVVDLDTIENALIERLRQGLGRLAIEVEPYSGELDELLPEVIRRFPAVWVTFGGISKTERISTARDKVKATGSFVVMVADRNLRGRNAARKGGAGEVGAYRLVKAVRRLLQQQDLGLQIDYLQPGRVRTLYNTRLQGEPITAFACEFSTAWIEAAMDNQTWPVEGRAEDAVFQGNQGQKDTEASDLLRIGAEYDTSVPGDGQPEATDLLELRS
ncbi:phage protein Gp37 [Chitinibacter sp. S2-10]|uniref:phage protein Gp37 n=1 Tax=Chitinibacter sp. S2-10 TaxID=3373597 RepID=UPI003977ABC4